MQSYNEHFELALPNKNHEQNIILISTCCLPILMYHFCILCCSSKNASYVLLGRSFLNSAKIPDLL